MAVEFKFNTYTTRYTPQNAYWMARAAKLAYKRLPDSSAPDIPAILSELKSWDPGFSQVYGFDEKSSQAIIIEHQDFIWIAFRGTDEWKDWLDNLNIPAIDHPLGRVHRGFQLALEDVWPAMLKKLDTIQQTHRRPVWITGHSLGGAMATLASADYIHKDRPFYGTYTFGQPRCGDRKFARFFNVEAKSRFFRFQNNNDIVTRIPQRIMGFSHVGTFIYIDNDLHLHTDIGFWFRFTDQITGILEALDEPGADWIEDHDIDHYIRALEKNIDINPLLNP